LARVAAALLVAVVVTVQLAGCSQAGEAEAEMPLLWQQKPPTAQPVPLVLKPRRNKPISHRSLPVVLQLVWALPQ
jgi:predicted component of type VI protein secretion system